MQRHTTTKKVTRGKGPRDRALPSAVASPANANKRQTQSQRASCGPGARNPRRPPPRQKAATRVAAASETPGRSSRTLHLRDRIDDKRRQQKAASPQRQRPAELPHGGRSRPVPLSRSGPTAERPSQAQTSARCGRERRPRGSGRGERRGGTESCRSRGGGRPPAQRGQEATETASKGGARRAAPGRARPLRRASAPGRRPGTPLSGTARQGRAGRPPTTPRGPARSRDGRARRGRTLPSRLGAPGG